MTTKYTITVINKLGTFVSTPQDEIVFFTRDIINASVITIKKIK